jgi:hypothetical protein
MPVYSPVLLHVQLLYPLLGCLEAKMHMLKPLVREFFISCFLLLLFPVVLPGIPPQQPSLRPLVRGGASGWWILVFMLLMLMLMLLIMMLLLMMMLLMMMMVMSASGIKVLRAAQWGERARGRDGI